MSEAAGSVTTPALGGFGDGTGARGKSPSEKLFESLGNDFAEPSTIDDAISEQGGLAGGDEPSVEEERTARGQGDEEPEPEAEEPEADDYLPEGKGSRDNPLTVKDLPQDKFVKVKVDGKEEVVDLRDCVDGYVRRQSFDRMTSRVNATMEEALTITREAVQERASIHEGFNSFLTDPKRLHAFLADNAPETVRELALIEANRYKEELANPNAAAERRIAAERKRLDAERAEWEGRQQAETRTRAEQQRIAQLQAAIAPGYQAGIKKAGLLGAKLTPEFVDTVKALAAPLQKRGELDAESMEAVVVRAAKLVPQGAVQGRKPAPAPVPAPRERTQQRRQGKDWDAMPTSQRLRDPDFFLRRSR